MSEETKKTAEAPEQEAKETEAAPQEAPETAAAPEKDAEADAAHMNRFIEHEILKQPAQYLWVHRRFKTRPPGQSRFY